MKLYNDFLEAGITLEEIELITNYAEGHDLELSELNGTFALLDLHEPESNRADTAWAKGLFEIVELMVKLNDELMESAIEEHDKNKINVLKEDEKIINNMYDKVHIKKAV